MTPGHAAKRAAVAGLRHRGLWMSLALAACGTSPDGPATSRLGYVVGTVRKSGGGPALASVRIVPVHASCVTDSTAVEAVSGTTDSLGRYRALLMATRTIGEFCVRVVAADYLVPSDSAVSGTTRVPIASRPDSARVDLVLP